MGGGGHPLGVAALLACGCGKSDEADAPLAKVGSREIRMSDISVSAGIPYDSLTTEERLPILEALVDRALVEQEGERRGLTRDKEIESRMKALRSELYLSRLLSELPAEIPGDSAIMAYYQSHQNEFLRPVDSYLIELYWAEDEGLMNRFRSQLLRGDTTMITDGIVSPEGRWLTESGELDRDFERELSSMDAGDATFPRPYEDGYRVAMLLEVFPAGTVLDIEAVGEEIAGRLMVEQSRARQEALMNALRERFPVKLLRSDSL